MLVNKDSKRDHLCLFDQSLSDDSGTYHTTTNLLSPVTKLTLVLLNSQLVFLIIFLFMINTYFPDLMILLNSVVHFWKFYQRLKVESPQ